MIQMNEKEIRADERKRMIRILDYLWEKEGNNIDNRVYAYPFEAMRDMIIKELNRDDVK